MSNLAVSLFHHERIVTTVAKAKELKSFAEKLITQAKGGMHRRVLRRIHDKQVFQKLFGVIAARYQNRPGGYVQVLRLGRRLGDNAETGLVRLVQ